MLYVNDAAAFLLEAASLILLGRWAWSIPKILWMKIALSVIGVLFFVVIWGLFFSPKARYPLSGPLRYVLEYLILLFPYLQFVPKNKAMMVLPAILIFINLFVQAVFGRADW